MTGYQAAMASNKTVRRVVRQFKMTGQAWQKCPLLPQRGRCSGEVGRSSKGHHGGWLHLLNEETGPGGTRGRLGLDSVKPYLPPVDAGSVDAVLLPP